MNVSNKKLEFPGSIENGLAAEEVKTQLAKYGFNEIPEKRSNFLVTFGKRFWGLVPWMLEITAILTFFLGKYPYTIIIVALLLFNAVLSLFQERRARSATTALKQRPLCYNSTAPQPNFSDYYINVKYIGVDYTLFI